jgi:hypothetical protein
MKILNSEIVNDFLIDENLSEKGIVLPDGRKTNVKFSTQQLQGHIDFRCGCKITQDKLGEWLFPCNKHNSKAYEFIKEGHIHKHLYNGRKENLDLQRSPIIKDRPGRITSL